MKRSQSEMPREHPHFEATYRVVPLNDGFSVEVVIPGSYPTTVSPFATAADAEAWIARHKREVETYAMTTGPFRRRPPTRG
jgi:hypothetical protein